MCNWGSWKCEKELTFCAYYEFWWELICYWALDEYVCTYFWIMCDWFWWLIFRFCRCGGWFSSSHQSSFDLWSWEREKVWAEIWGCNGCRLLGFAGVEFYFHVQQVCFIWELRDREIWAKIWGSLSNFCCIIGVFDLFLLFGRVVEGWGEWETWVWNWDRERKIWDRGLKVNSERNGS